MEETMSEMTEEGNDRVIFGLTGWEAAKEQGMMHADMHFHTNCSDSYTDANSLLKLARERGTGVAITDHNLIDTLRKIDLKRADVMVIPGMEVSTTDGPHVLVYFFDMNQLEEFWSREIRPRLCMRPWLALNDCTTEKLLDLLEKENCVVSAAHPMGYFNSDKGVEICHVKGRISKDVVDRLDAYEVICSGMSHKNNLDALEAANRHGLSYTGGTDGHLLSEVGNVVTICDSDDLDGFLEAIAKGRSKVIGREKTSSEKVKMGTACFSKFVEHAPSSIITKVTHNTGVASRKKR